MTLGLRHAIARPAPGSFFHRTPDVGFARSHIFVGLDGLTISCNRRGPLLP